MEELIAALRAEGMRITESRKAICSVVASSGEDHLSASDIRSRASKVTGRSVDQSTVYRTLDVLETLGFLHHVHLGHGPGVFHLSDDVGHHHLVCENCGAAVDVPLADISPILDEVAARHGYTVRGAHFALTGLCGSCQNA
ncbi:MAG: transcriptional repressor [Acidimicrobiia bacterium]|nr:transcriptional repressor [Acidimicrobiia bacterium]